MARCRALQFVGITLAASFAWEAVLIANGGLEALGAWGVLLLMWLPGMVAMGLVLATRGEWKGLGLSRGTKKSWLLALLVPAACGAFTYGAALALGLVELAPPKEAVDAGRATLGHWARDIPMQLLLGSVFPPMLAHGVHNVVYQNVFDRWFAGPQEPYFAGEQGLFSIVAYGVVAAVTLRALRRSGAERSARP